MAIKNDREYRDFKSFGLIEHRAEDDTEGEQGLFVEGYASTFEIYDLFEVPAELSWEGKREIYREQIDKNAFDETDMSDVVFLRDHTGQVLARTKNKLVRLSIDDKGLFTRTDLSKTEGARAMYEDIKAQNYTQMSFAFISDRGMEDWTEERSEDTIIYTRTIKRIKKIFDVSAVGFPANPATDIAPATRSIFDGAIENMRAERLAAEARAKAVQRLTLKIKLYEEEHK